MARRRRGFGVDNMHRPTEPTKAQLAGVSATVIDDAGEFVPFGMVNGVQFPNGIPAGTESARPGSTPLIPLATYMVSVFVIMDAGGAPVVGTSTALGDFCLAVDGAIAVTAATVTQINGNLYRVSVSKACTAAPAQNNSGVFRFTTQTGRGFKVTGFNLTPGSILQPYQKAV